MLHIQELLGGATESRCAGRIVERLTVTSDEATKRRLRRTTDGGTDVAVDLPRGSFLAHGAVLHEDAARIIVIERTPERALVIRFDPAAPAAALLRSALLIGHAFGNQHTPLEIRDDAVVVPLTTSESVARTTVDMLSLDTVEVSIEEARVACATPLTAGHGHGSPADPAGPHVHE